MTNKRYFSNFIEINKRKIALGIVTIGVLSSITVQTPYNTIYAAGDSAVHVLVEGQKLNSDIGAYIKNDRTLIPLRVVMEKFGAQVKWDQTNNAVDIFKDNKNVKLYIDNRLVSYTENGVTTYDVSDVAPVIINNYTYVPVRLVSNALGLNVTWNQSSREVNVFRGEGADKAKFFDIDILGVNDGQVISDKTTLTLSGAKSLPSNAAQLRYLFLDPVTGEGKIVAKTNKISEPVVLTPDINNQGNGILAAVVYDKNGNFIAGAAKTVTTKITPKVTLKGVNAGQTLSVTTPLSCDLNFTASYTKYEIHYPNRDIKVYTSGEIDPAGSFGYMPETFENGEVALRVVAYDANDKPYYSDFVNVNIAAKAPEPQPPYVSLASIPTKNVGVVPVTLSVSRNFNNVSKTQYYAKNTSTGNVVLLYEVGFGEYSWFPGPDMAGTWDIYVKCTTTLGNVYTSNARTVTVPKKESIIISGVGPNQVITEAFSVNSKSNVSLKDVTYVIINPQNGSQKVIGTSKDTSTKVSFTPTIVNEGNRNIQAIATTTDGRTIKSDIIPIKFYLGELYGSRPVVAQDKFIEYVTPMALKTQKENGMSAALQIAQAILETGWGQKLPVDKYTGLFSNNLFGVKGTGNAGSVLCSTWEEYYGTVYRIDDNFRAYKTVQDSWNDHNALLTTRERYIPYTEVMHNSTAGAYALRRCGYATDSGYPGKLIYLIERWDLDKFDNQKI